MSRNLKGEEVGGGITYRESVMRKDKGHERSEQVINKEWQVSHMDGRDSSAGGEGRDAAGRMKRLDGEHRGPCTM